MTPLLDFLAHRLQREEWTKQAVISFGKLYPPAVRTHSLTMGQMEAGSEAMEAS